MATVHSYVDPDASGSETGVDWTNAHTSLDDWNTDEQTNLVTDGDIHICHVRSSSGGDDIAAMAIDGWTTGASNYIEVRCDNDATYGYNRHTGGWDASKYIIDGDDAHSINIAESYVRIFGLQVTCTYTATAGLSGIAMDGWHGAFSDIRIAYCIIDPDGSDSNYGSGIAGNINGTDGVIYIYNNLVMNAPRGVSNPGSVNIDSYFYNNTVVHCTMGGADGYHFTGASVTYSYNNIAADCGDDFNDSGASINIDYCASDDGDGTNAQTLSGTRSDDFADWSGGDYSIVSGSDCVGNGADNPGTGLYSDDIIEVSRSSTWDIGAFEFVGESPSISPSISPSVSPSVSPSASVSPSEEVSGSVTWGHDTAVVEDNILNFSGNWTGTGTISGSGDSEIMTLDDGEYMELTDPFNLGEGNCTFKDGKYQSTTGVLTKEYKTGASVAACNADTWHTYTAPFTSLGYVKLRVEN